MDFLLIFFLTMSAIITLKLYQKLLPQMRIHYNKYLALISHSINPLINYSTNNINNNKDIPRIYTRTGDNGTSGLFSGDRRLKNDNIFEALGTTDELSSAIGFAREFIKNKEINEELERVQCILQDLQSTIATPRTSAKESQIEKTKWDFNHLIDLELWIDRHSLCLPPLKNFILPSGGKASASLHMARAIARRAERRLIPLLDEGLELPILQYLNRLSSYLFTIARVCALNDGFSETIYRKPKCEDS